MSCISAHDPQLAKLADAIAQRVGQQRFSVWFNNSTRLDLRQDGLEIAVPNDFISEWIGRNFTQPIQDAAAEVLGCSLAIRFSVMPDLFEGGVIRNSEKTEGKAHTGINGVGAGGHGTNGHSAGGHATGRRNANGNGSNGHAIATPVNRIAALESAPQRETRRTAGPMAGNVRLRHDLTGFVVGSSNQLAYNAAGHVAEHPGQQYNPLFIHGACGLGKTHLLQGLCKRFIENHPTKRWLYLTGEEFTNEFLFALRSNKLDAFRRRVRDLDLLVIDDVHFLSGKNATQEEFLHTFNSIEAMGRQVVMASDHHPKMIEEFGESLVNRFVSGMVVRVDPPNLQMRCQILRQLVNREKLEVDEEVIAWVARRITQNVRELEGGVTRITAHVRLTGRKPDLALVQEALGDLERQLVAPVKPDSIVEAVCTYFGIEMRELMSGRRHRTISLARSVAMHLIRKTAKLSFPEIGTKMGKRNHSTVISACRRMERAIEKNENLTWISNVGQRTEEATELIQRLEELSRSMN